MKGPYMANIDQKNHVLEKTKKIKLSNFLLNLILNFDFSISQVPVQSKNENHQNSMSDSSKEPYGFTGHKSEEKTKKY